MKRLITAADGLSASDREAIAKTTKDPQELQRLAYDKSVKVRLAVAENPATPQDTLIYLADDDNHKIQWAVASTEDPAVIDKLADDGDYDIRYIIVNRTDDPTILAKLADDKNYGIRRIVARRTDDSVIFAKLADDEDWGVRWLVADNTNDLEILVKLADDEDSSVRFIAEARLKRLCRA